MKLLDFFFHSEKWSGHIDRLHSSMEACVLPACSVSFSSGSCVVEGVVAVLPDGENRAITYVTVWSWLE